MTLERISAFITYCIAVVMLAINWYYKHKAYQLLRDGQISREDYESINR